jgi:pre-mRNA-splicing factor ATP-dependent RNA helicase DHX15/PRP43
MASATDVGLALRETTVSLRGLNAGRLKPCCSRDVNSCHCALFIVTAFCRTQLALSLPKCRHSEQGSSGPESRPALSHRKAFLAHLAQVSPGVVLTQNRRLAADSVASRIASELDVYPGTLVGLKHSGQDLTTASTRLDVVTDGMLLAMTKSDPGFQKYNIIVIDVAHGHSIATDLVMAFAKLALAKNSKLKIVILSAIINRALFLSYFPGAILQDIPGRVSAVKRLYLKNDASSVNGVLVKFILQAHVTGRAGNILVFVSGEREINDTIQSVRAALKAKFGKEEGDSAGRGKLECYPLFGALPDDEQYHTVNSVPPLNGSDGSFGRKLIVATNTAETSVPLTGVTHVIDSGKAKSKLWDPETESWSLEEHYISKSEVAQRSGRAGRTRDGESYLMMTEYGFTQLPDHPTPDILKGDMVRECLHLLIRGMNPVMFPYINPPASETIAKALGTLASLNLVDEGVKLTDRGKMVESFGIDPQLGVALIESVKRQCSDEIISIAAMIEATEVMNVFIASDDKDMKAKILEARAYFRYPGSDHLTLFNIYMAWKQACVDDCVEDFLRTRCLRKSVLEAADASRMRLLRILLNAQIPSSAVSKGQIATLHGQGRNGKDFYLTVLRCLAAGNYLRVAKRNPATKKYETVPLRQEVSLQFNHNHSDADSSNEWIFFNTFYDQPGDKISKTIRVVTAIAPEWLFSSASHYWSGAEFMPSGHIQDGIVEVLARMTGMDPAGFHGGMPDPPSADLATGTDS